MIKFASVSEDVPWYTSALGGAAGALAGGKLKKYKTLGQLGGTLVGTGVGLTAGRVIAKRLKARKESTRNKSAALELVKIAGVDTYVGPSEDMDRGMFAERDFEPGEIIEVAPILVVPRAQIKAGDVLRNYVFNFDEKNVMVALGYASMFNHSYKPNARYKKDKAARTLTFTAIKPIKEGQEIFVNYNLDPNNQTPLWFDVKEKQTEKTAATPLEMALINESPSDVAVHRGNVNAYMPFGANKAGGGHVTTPVISYRGNNPAILAHEVGHAKNYDLVGKRAIALRTPMSAYGGGGTAQVMPRTLGLAGLGAVAGNLAAQGDEEAGGDTKVRRALALGVPAALVAPTLLDEGVASARGLAMMKRHGATRGQMMRGAGRLAAAGATYAIPPALVAGATYAGMRSHKNSRDGEKMAAMRRAFEEMV